MQLAFVVTIKFRIFNQQHHQAETATIPNCGNPGSLAAIFNQINGHILATKTTRKKIPTEIEAEVMFRSNRQCCIDQKRGDHIHHINGNNADYSFENLALLCFDCHNEASMKGSLRKKISPKLILKYRHLHYKTIQSHRDSSLKNLNKPISKLTSEDLLTAAKNALIIIEVEKIKEEYYIAASKEKGIILTKLLKFENHKNNRVCYDIFNFLSEVANETRSNLPFLTISEIHRLVFSFFPSSYTETNNKQFLEVGILCNDIGFSITYDSMIHLNDLSIANCGLSILKYVLIISRRVNSEELRDTILNSLKEMENQLNRPERNDLENAKDLLKLYLNELESNDTSFPIFPEYLYNLIIGGS